MAKNAAIDTGEQLIADVSNGIVAALVPVVKAHRQADAAAIIGIMHDAIRSMNDAIMCMEKARATFTTAIDKLGQES